MPLGRTETGSAWGSANRSLGVSLLRKQLMWGNPDTTEQTVWLDWFFGSAGASPAALSSAGTSEALFSASATVAAAVSSDASATAIFTGQATGQAVFSSQSTSDMQMLAAALAGASIDSQGAATADFVASTPAVVSTAAMSMGGSSSAQFVGGTPAASRDLDGWRKFRAQLLRRREEEIITQILPAVLAIIENADV